MKVLKPIKFEQSMLLSSTATDSTPAYNASTTYSKDQVVQYQGNIYVSLIDSNTGKTPGAPTSILAWLLKGASNVYAMFDSQVSTQSISTAPFKVTIAPGAVIDTLAFINISTASSAKITALDRPGGDTVFSKTYTLDTIIVTDWLQYFFEPFDLASELIVQGIPLYSTIVITVEINSGSSIGVGSLLMGSIYELGSTSYGASLGIRDYSVKNTDDFGNTTFVQRPFSRRGSFSVNIQKGNLNKASRVLESIRATPVVWIASDEDEYQFSTIFGFYKDYNIEISYPTHSLCSLDIEGMI